MSNILQHFTTLIYLIISIFLVGCATNKNINNNSKYKENALLMAAQYTKKAELINYGQQRDQYYLTAADYFIKAAAYTQANQLLKSLDAQVLNEVQNDERQILLAAIALAEQNLETADLLLAKVPNPSKLPINMQINFYRTRADTALRTGNILNAVQDRISLAFLLTDDAAIKENNLAIWNDLLQLTPDALNEYINNASTNVLIGWLKFAYINKQYDITTTDRQNALVLWQQEYPGHPANQILYINQINAPKIQNFENNQIEEVSDLHKIGLLLPLTGPHANSAKAVKDGFITAFYQDNAERKKPAFEIKIYDTNSPNTVIEAYKNAKEDAVSFIVGPLTKQEVDSIASNHNLTIPVLALNNTSSKKTNIKNLYQFGLPPDPQAKTVAIKAWQNGYKNAGVIVLDNQWGKRILQAFVQEWEGLGGNITATISIANTTNLDEIIQEFLHINKSKNRAMSLKNIGIKAQFTPRPRSDLDFIFLATDSNNAKQIKPLLDFYFASNIPIYASSSVYAANNNAADTDLDGIYFCDMPWILDPAIKLRSNYQTISKLASNFEESSRLYALGLDAYKIIKEFKQLHSAGSFGISGMTGILTINQDNTIDQKLIWAKIKNGKAILETVNEKYYSSQ